jgi:glycosyltransferase involved in cell wall biosynthesis
VYRDKRPELYLDLARRLPHRKFVLIGGPGDASGCYERVRALATALPNVECTGFLPLAQVEPWFDRARVVVNTSVYEGMPNTFMQAWARGVPTVATVDVGAPVHQVFTDVEDGAARIERLFADETHWAEAATRCKAYFQNVHSSEAVTKQYGEVFERPAREAAQ